jgi:hypothetical protein
MYATEPYAAGYTYQAEVLCPPCMMRALGFPGYSNAEETLDRLAERQGIDRDDERSFDSGEFPKVILSSGVHGDCTPEEGCDDRCLCGDYLGTETCYPDPE